MKLNFLIIIFACLIFVVIINLPNTNSNSNLNENLINIVPKKAYKRCNDNCDINEYEDNDAKLIRDVVIGRKYQQSEPISEFTNNDVEKYYSDYIDFDNKINYSSKNRYDMVEKLAQARANNTDLTQYQGKTIAELYDDLIDDSIVNNKKYQE